MTNVIGGKLNDDHVDGKSKSFRAVVLVFKNSFDFMFVCAASKRQPYCFSNIEDGGQSTMLGNGESRLKEKEE